MLEREWLSIVSPLDVHDRSLFDVTFLLSGSRCIYGAGCRGTGSQADAEAGCCRLGAHYVDDDDARRVEAMVDVLGPAFLQQYGEAVRGGVTAQLPDGERRTRILDGACIFLNRGHFRTGAGCALHHYAVARGEHHMTYKPEVCWIVPLRREVAEDVADDGAPRWTTTVTSYDRGAWGPGGAEFGWWCTESEAAYVSRRPLFRTMESELRHMVGDEVYEELADYLDRRCADARPPPRLLPLRVL